MPADTQAGPVAADGGAAAAEAFIAKWLDVTASGLSTPQSFLIDLCRRGAFVLDAAGKF